MPITEKQILNAVQEAFETVCEPDVILVRNRAQAEQLRILWGIQPDYFPKLKDLRAIEQRLGHYASR